jgi:hypothetical protein
MKEEYEKKSLNGDKKMKIRAKTAEKELIKLR